MLAKASWNSRFEVKWNDYLTPDDKRRKEAHDAERSLVRAILTALSSAGIDCEGWRTIESAKKDRTVIWAALHPDIYPRIEPERKDLERLNGVQVPLQHPGVYEKDGRKWDHGWTVAAPVGYGGIPDEWIAGWRPLPPLASGGG